ncbi:MAG: hypothetical protein ABGX82_14455 [Pseudomonas sp.]|uniref:hypothetical protein n=1 Tax=Pseudomonas sp. TaxID=306 RepID=UPI0032424972
MQINREGHITFGDFTLNIWEDGIGDARRVGGIQGVREWEKRFRREVFKRVIQQLNRLGWTVGPWCDAELYDSKSFASNHRTISKGEHLHGLLDLSGRCIKLEMWQSAITPTRPDHDGRYESNKEGVAPFLVRLEMERTRRRIRDYLCGVFSGYTFDDKRRSTYRKPLEATALEQVARHYAESCHFKGDLSSYAIRDENRKSADNQLLEHGQRVWFFDCKGRCCTGIAYYNINNMWWVVTGKWDYTNEAAFRLYAQCPAAPRIKRNERLRRSRLERELSCAVSAMDYQRAELIKHLIFPDAESLFLVWHKGHQAYHRANFSGYTRSAIEAGKFTRSEVTGYDREPNEVRPLSAA